MSIAAFYTDSFTLGKYTGKDEFSNPLPTSDSIIKGRFEFSDFLVSNKRGEEVMSKARIFMSPSTEIDERDFITKDNIKYRVFQVRKPARRSGIHHQEVIVA